MRILLYADYRYPIAGGEGSGIQPRAFPSGSAFHLHELLARGLTEEGHEVFYHTVRGADADFPGAVRLVSRLPEDADIYHGMAGPPGVAEPMLEVAARNGKASLLSCHMLAPDRVAAPNWVYVSRSLAHAYGSDRFILNGLDPDDYIFSEAKQDYFLFLSALDRITGKGLDVALELSRREGLRLIVAGTCQTWEAIGRVGDLCAQAGAEYVGDVRGVRKAELLAGARALLFPSRLSEGCPLVILEAMFSGTPVISSTAGGSVEIVTSETGILCASEEEWSLALNRLDAISPRRCREIAIEKYHYRRMTSDYVKEYRREIDSAA
jgi:glycosyltransferase involved in cell wall biosynthesis